MSHHKDSPLPNELPPSNQSHSHYRRSRRERPGGNPSPSLESGRRHDRYKDQPRVNKTQPPSKQGKKKSKKKSSKNQTLLNESDKLKGGSVLPISISDFVNSHLVNQRTLLAPEQEIFLYDDKIDARRQKFNTKQFSFNLDHLKFISLTTIKNILKKNRNNYEVVSVIKEPLVPDEKNYSSILASLRVYFIDNEVRREINLVAKVIPDGYIKRKLPNIPLESDNFLPTPIQLFRPFKRERAFYESVWPRMAYLGKMERKYDDPDYIVARYLTGSPSCCLYFENLESKSYKRFQHGFLNIKECLMAMNTIARLHAASIALKSHHPTVTSRFKSLTADWLDINNIYYHIYTILLRTLASEVTKWPGYEKFAHPLYVDSTLVYDEIVNIRTSNYAHNQVFLHGNFWAGNLLYRNDAKQQIEDVGRLIDFQHCQWGNPAIDILHFLYVSAEGEILRSKHFKKLLFDRYYNEIQKVLAKNFELPATVFPKINFQKDLHEAYFYGILNGLTMRWFTRATGQCNFDSLIDSYSFNQVNNSWRQLLQNDESLKQSFKFLLDDAYKGGFFQNGVIRLKKLIYKKRMQHES